MSIVLNLQVENYSENDSFRPDYSPIISRTTLSAIFTEPTRISILKINSVNAGHHIPKNAALEAGGGLGNELPDLTELVIPDIQGFFQVLYDPVV